MSACDSLAQLALSICYLSHGFRAGKAERLTPKALAGGSLVLSRVVTKTKTNRTPAASLALRTCIPLLEAGAALPQGVERKRFRPTAAVSLLLAGVPMLEVMERLGHGSLAMLTNHYAKVTPDDYAGSTSLSVYLSCGRLTVDGHAVQENTPLPLFFPEGRDRPRRQGPIHILCFPRGVTVDLGLMEYSARALRAAGRHEGVVLTRMAMLPGPSPRRRWMPSSTQWRTEAKTRRISLGRASERTLSDTEVAALLRAVEEHGA